MFGRLKELLSLYGVSGDEGRVRRYIRDAVKPLSSEVYTDGMGNLYAHKKGEGPKIMLTAHMDESGLMVVGIMDDGLLAYTTDGIDPRVVVSKRVVVGKNDIPAVIGSKAIHLQSKDDRKRALKHDELFVDIGAKDKADAEKDVEVGDYVSFVSNFTELGDGFFASKAIDDRAGCAVLIELLKGDYDCDLYAVFTVHHEIGQRGLQAAMYNVKPDLVLSVDGIEADDSIVREGAVTNVACKGGAAISYMDSSLMVKYELFTALRDTAIQNDIPFTAVHGGAQPNGRTGRFLFGCPFGLIGIPVRQPHSPTSVAACQDVMAVMCLIDTFLKDKTYKEVL